MQVELDVFSGRRNPHWELTSQEAGEFLNVLQSLPVSNVVGLAREGLGYRGLIVTEAEDSIEGYDEFLICDRIVEARRGNNSQQFADDDRALERWLLQTGKGRLDDNLYQQTLSEMERH